MKNTLTFILAYTLAMCVGLTSLTAQTFTNYTTDEGLVNNAVNCLAVAPDGSLWFGTQNGVSNFDGSSWVNYQKEDFPGMVDNTVFAISAFSDGSIWIGTDFGASHFNGTSWTAYTEADGLSDDRVKYISEQENGAAYFANYDGLSIFENGTWTSYTDEIPFGGVNFVSDSPTDDIWLGTPLSGVFIFDGTTDFQVVDEEQDLLSDKIRSIATDQSNNMWVANSDGLSVFNTAGEHLVDHEFIFDLPAPHTLNPIEDVKVDSHGRIWAGVYIDYLVNEGGVSMYDGFDWVQYETEDGLVGPVVRRLEIDSEDNVWVATGTGVTKISDVPVSTSSIQEQEQISIFPNPTTNTLLITAKNGTSLEKGQVQIINTSGQVVRLLEIKSFENQLTIDVSDFPKGIYVAKINDQSIKFIVQ